jgi:hypothetical protein
MLGISRAALLCILGFVSSCAKSKDKGAAASAATPGTPAPTSAAPAAAATNTVTGCRGTLSGPVSGSLTCESTVLFFLPPYQDATLRGNSEVSLLSSARFQQGKPPPGVDLVTWAGVIRGPIQPGTYTEKNLLHTGLDVAAVDIAGRKRVEGLKRMKLVVKSISSAGVHDDIMMKKGPMRNDKIVGEMELVIGDASDQVVIQATLN